MCKCEMKLTCPCAVDGSPMFDGAHRAFTDCLHIFPIVPVPDKRTWHKPYTDTHVHRARAIIVGCCVRSIIL